METINGIEFIQNISKEIENRWQAYEASDNSSKSKELYMYGMMKTAEHILHLVPTLYILIANEQNRKTEGNNYDERTYIRQYIGKTNRIKGERAFLVGLVNEIDTITKEAGAAKELLEELTETIREDMTLIRKIKNMGSHDTLTIDTNEIKDIYIQNKTMKKGEKEKILNMDESETLKMPLQTVQKINRTIATAIKNNNITEFDSDNYEFLDNEQHRRIHRTGLLCMDPLTQKILTYRETSLKKVKKGKMAVNKYSNESVAITTRDKDHFIDCIQFYLGIKNTEDWKEQTTIVPGEKNIPLTIEIISFLKDKNIPCYFQYRIKKIDENNDGTKETVLTTQKSENFGNEGLIEKTIAVEEIITETGDYRIECYIRKGISDSKQQTDNETHEIKDFLSYMEITLTAEEKQPGTVHMEIGSLHEMAQHSPGEIEVTLTNTGNITKQIQIEFEIEDKAYFTIQDIRESRIKVMDEVEERDESKKHHRIVPITLKGYEKKDIIIEILPMRSEEKDYNLGTLTIKDKTGEITKEKKFQKVFITKSYQPRNFYNRKALINELTPVLQKEEGISYKEIQQLWIKGEAGQGKSRIAKRIKELSETYKSTCLTIGYERPGRGNTELLRQTCRELRKELKKHPLAEIVLPEEGIGTGQTEEENAVELLSWIEAFRKNKYTPSKVVLQIDDVHFADLFALEKLMNVIQQYNQTAKASKTEKGKSDMAIIFYSRTLEGLGAIAVDTHLDNGTADMKKNERQKEEQNGKKEPTTREKIHALMNTIIPEAHQYTLITITSEDMEAGTISSEEEMIREITEEIFTPHEMTEEIDELTKILTLKSEANPLILELLIKELAKTKKLIIWDEATEKWVFNRESLDLRRREGETGEETYKRVLTEKLKALYPEDKGLKERLLMNEIKEFKGTEAELIINLVGMLDGVDEEELEAQNLNVKKYPRLMGILKVETKEQKDDETDEIKKINRYSFKHHLYEEYWERYFEEEIRPLFETWNKERESLKEDFSNEEIEEWLKETQVYIDLEQSTVTNRKKRKIEKEYKEKIFENGEKYIDLLEEDISKDFNGEERFMKYLNMRKLLENGFERRGEIDDSYTIRYGLYRYFAEKEGFEEIEAYYDRFVNSMVDNIHQYKYNEQFEKDMRFLVEKVLKELEGEAVDDYWAGLAYHYLADTQEVKGNYEEARELYSKTSERMKSFLKNNPENENAYSQMGLAIQSKGEILAGTGRLVEALKTYDEAIVAYETAITLNSKDGDFHSNKGNAIQSKGDILAGMGRLVEALKTYEEAIVAYETAITLNPKKANFHSNKGNVLNRKGLLLQQAGERKHARDSIKMAIKSHQKVLILNPHDTRRYRDILRDIQALEQLIETEEEKTMITEQYLSVKEKLEAFQKTYPTIEKIKEIIGWIEQRLENEQKSENEISLTKKIQQILEKNSGTPGERILLLVAVTGYVTEQQLQDEGLKIEAGDSTMQLLEKKMTEQDGKTIHYYNFKDKDHWQTCESLLLEELRTLGGKFSNKQLEENNELSQMETAEYSRYDLIRKQLTKGFNTHKGNNIEGVRRYGRYLLVMNESVFEVKVEWFQIMQYIQKNMSDVIKNDNIVDQIKMMIQDSLPEIKKEEPEDLLIGFSYYTYGEMTFHKANYAEAEKNHRLAISEFEKIDTTNEKASKFIQNLLKNSLKTLSIIYKERGAILHIIDEKEEGRKRFETAKRYAEKAIETDEQNYSNHLLLGEIYKAEGDCAEKTLKLEKYEKAQEAYEMAAEIEANEDTMKYLAIIVILKASVYKEKGENETAKSLFNKAKEYMEKTINFCEDENMIKAYKKGIEDLEAEIKDLEEDSSEKE